MDQPLALMPPLRPLGATECVFAWFSKHGWVTHVVVNQLRVCPPMEHLRQALSWLRDRHRVLAVQIALHQGALHFVPCQASPVLTHSILEPSNDPRWPPQAHDFLQQGFEDPTQLLWRVHLAEVPGGGASVVWAFHHALEDGISAEVLAHELIMCLRALRAGEALPQMPKPVLHERVETLTQAKLTWSMKFGWLLKVLGRVLVKPHTWIEKDAPVNERSTQVLCRVLPQDLTKALVQRTRQEKTTVYGALCAAMLLVARRQMGLPRARLVCDASINMRALCQPPVAPDAVGMFISSISWMYQVKEDTNFWDLARQTKQRTMRCIERGDAAQVPLLLDWTRTTPEELAKEADNKGGRNQAVFVSNIGRYPYPEDHDELVGVFNAGGQHARGASLWMSAVTLGGQLQATFTYVDPILGAETAQRAVDEVMEQLRLCVVVV